jgi:sigma-B regulation protein RsbU (phosphoserine phosphatase)
MTARLAEWIRNLGRLDRAFIVGIVVWVVLRFAAPDSAQTILLAFILYILGMIILFRVARRMISKTVWRLRNRLITVYLFVGLVPVVLIVMLAVLTAYTFTGQIAGFLVNSELNRRAAALARPAAGLAGMPAEMRDRFMRDMNRFMGQFPNLALLLRQGKQEFRVPADADLQAPPPGWKDTHGLLLRNGAIYAWAYAARGETEVVMAAPLDDEFLSALVPGLGDFDLIMESELERRGTRKIKLGAKRTTAHSGRVPPAHNSADIQVGWWYPVPVQVWENPGQTVNAALTIQTRPSAVLAHVFGRNVILEDVEWGKAIWWSFLTISGLFLAVELVSFIIGVSLTRTITSAVDELYLGTQRVMEGDFSHRIHVRGKDQLAELGVSFNAMTANLERLIGVAKEKERLQSELEIAREVQNQLFPTNVPDLRTLQVTGICNPARMVSGDYYDFMCLTENTLAFAIGDVAGKGISAALLMATIQSTMRTQLNAGIAAAAAAGNGGARPQVSTAQLVATLNKQLYANTSPEKYATFFFGLYDDRVGNLLYTNAGHLGPILVRDGSPSCLEVTGTVVGAFPFTQYDEKSIRLAPGDLLVAYTDGIVEPENEYGEMFGEERLTDLLVKHADGEGAEVIARVMESVRQWTGEGELQDDMTMLVARRI